MNLKVIDHHAAKAHTCSCKNSNRTVGMCSHAAFFIWYLGFGQFQDLPLNAAKLNENFQNNFVIESDGEEEI